MEWVERDIEDVIFNNPRLIGCDVILGRQLQVGVGIIDILAARTRGRKGSEEWQEMVVVEIKRDRIDCNAVGQIIRYINALVSVPTPDPLLISGILLGQSIDTDALVLAEVLQLEFRRFEARLTLETEVRIPIRVDKRLDEAPLAVLHRTTAAALDSMEEFYEKQALFFEMYPDPDDPREAAASEKPEGTMAPTDQG